MAQFIGFGNGHDGSVSSATGTINSYSAMTGTAGSTTVTTNLSVDVGDIVMLHQTRHASNAGKWELVRVVATGSGSFTADRPLEYTYESLSQAVLVPQYTGGTCANNITGASWNGTTGGIIALVCNGTLTLSGSIKINGGNGSLQTSASLGGGGTGGGFRGGDAQGDSQNEPAERGEDTKNVDVQSTSGGHGGGGGGTNNGDNRYGGGGAGGSHGSIGQDGASSWGYQGYTGSVNGSAALTTMNLGSGGGGGCAGGGVSGSNAPGGGGSGGGIILVIARNISVSGSIQSNGGNGCNAACETPDTTVAYGGGGGGSGGSILIKAQNATLGSGLITATGGTGGTSKRDNYSPVSGGNGGVGRIRLDYLVSYSGTTNPTLSVGQNPSLYDCGGNFMSFL